MNINTLENGRNPGAQCWHYKRISWGAILAGAVTALIIEALLNLLGVGINLISFTPDKQVMTGLGIGSIIWLVIVSIIALFIAGWVAGLASGKNTNISGAMQGFLTWAVSGLMVLILMASTMGVIIGGVTSFLAQGLKSAGEIALKIDDINIEKLPGVDSLQQRLKSGVSKEKMLSDFTQAAESYLTAKNDSDKTSARQSLTTTISENTDLSPEESNQKIMDIEQNYQTALDNIEKQSKKISRVIGSTAIVGVISFLLGAIAGIVGGMMGSRRNYNI